MPASDKSGAEKAADKMLEDPAAAVQAATRLADAEAAKSTNPEPVLPDGTAVVRLILSVEDVWTPEAAASAFVDEVVRHGLNAFNLVVQRSDGEVFIVHRNAIVPREEVLVDDGTGPGS